MSATLKEYEKIAQWMQAETYVTHFRPLELKEFLLIDKIIYDYKTMEKLRLMDNEYNIKSDTKGYLGYFLE